MATTILEEYEGDPTLTPEKIAIIKQWYKEVQGDEDKATDIDDHEFYAGGVDMVLNILCLLYNCPTETIHPHTTET